jgi:hypothetical protein
MSIENKDIENIETVDITVTQESMDAHVQCLKENGYRVNKPFTLFTNYAFWMIVGMCMGAYITGRVFLGY